MLTYPVPGVYREELYPAAASDLQTGVPAFLGVTPTTNVRGELIPINAPQRVTLWPQFEQQFGAVSNSYLADAVRGFLVNGGQLCYVVRLDADASSAAGAAGKISPEALAAGLAAIAPLDTIDLVCVPDIMRDQPTLTEVVTLQQKVLDHCDTLGDRFAILDAVSEAKEDRQKRTANVPAQRQQLHGDSGALYGPWVEVQDNGETKSIPPCGHIAGTFARIDQRIGVHKAPANERLEGVVGLTNAPAEAVQSDLNAAGINELRVCPGRGIRVWGARTLSRDRAWQYINVRRLFITVGRWIERHLAHTVFEPNTSAVWDSIRRDLSVYLNGLAQQGALLGAAPEEAFYIKCDAETNPPEIREAGMIVAEIGLAAAVPGEFIRVQLFHGPSGVTIRGPT